MSRSEYFGFVALLLSMASASPLSLAQAPAEDPQEASTPAATDSAKTDAVEDSERNSIEPQREYAASLDGTGLISMDTRASGHLLLGATTSGGWDSNPENFSKSVGTPFYTISPYVGIQQVTPRLSALLQYQYTNTGFNSNYARQSINVASATILHSINDRWSWDLKASGSYGQDAVRFLGNQQTVAVGAVAGSGPNSASYLPNAGTGTSLNGGFGVRYRKSEREAIEIRATNIYSHYSGITGTNSTATVGIAYDRDVSPTLGLFAYEQNSVYYGFLHCKTYGTGLGLRWTPRQQMRLSLSGGPQLDASGCGSQQGFAFDGAFSARLTGRSQMYLLAARQPTTSYLGPGLWQQSVSAGYQREVTTLGTAGVDIGYVGSSTLASLSSYHGTYFDGAYTYAFRHGLRASYSYRGYFGNSGGTKFGRNVAQFSLTWAPSSGHILQ